MAEAPVSAEYDCSEEPMWRVMRRWGMPTTEPKATDAINALREADRDRFALFLEEIRAERQTVRPLTDEEIEEIRSRQVEAEQRELEQRAANKQLQGELRNQFGDTLLARKMAAQVGVDLDADYS